MLPDLSENHVIQTMYSYIHIYDNNYLCPKGKVINLCVVLHPNHCPNQLHSYRVGYLYITTQFDTGVSIKSYHSNSNSMVSIINCSTSHYKRLIPEKQGKAAIVVTLQGY